MEAKTAILKELTELSNMLDKLDSALCNHLIQSQKLERPLNFKIDLGLSCIELAYCDARRYHLTVQADLRETNAKLALFESRPAEAFETANDATKDIA